MHTHTPKIDGQLAADSAEITESEICSPQDPIVYHSCRFYGCNCQHHDLEASWDLLMVATLMIRFRLPYRQRWWFRPTYAACHTPHATCRTLPAARQTLPAIHHQPQASQCLQLSKSLDRACRSIHGSNSQVRLEVCSLLRAYLGAYSQAG